jgi:hypothetical protein
MAADAGLDGPASSGKIPGDLRVASPSPMPRSQLLLSVQKQKNNRMTE